MTGCAASRHRARLAGACMACGWPQTAPISHGGAVLHLCLDCTDTAKSLVLTMADDRPAVLVAVLARLAADPEAAEWWL